MATFSSTVIAQMMAHQSIRKFTDQPVPQALVEEIVAAGQAASSSSFVQVTTVIQVNDQDRRQTLESASGGQLYVSNCPVFLVFCADLKRNQQICAERGINMPTGFAEQALIASIDTGIFSQNTLLAAESVGLGGVYIGGIRNHPQMVTECLNLPDQVIPLFGMCLGYPAQDPGLKPRLPVTSVLHQDTYASLDKQQLVDYDQVLSDYYQQRTKGKLQTTFSEHIEKTLNKEARPHMLNYLQAQGFFQK